MSNPGELSILSKWLQEKLASYFIKKSKNQNCGNWSYTDFTSASKQSNRPPIEVPFFDFRILDLQLETDEDQNDETTTKNRSYYPTSTGLFDVVHDEVLRTPTKSEQEPYKQGNSHVYLVYQKGCQSVGRELLLHMYAAEIDDMDLVGYVPKFILSLDEHQIDVYTQVFPLLKAWAKSQDVVVNFSVPECFYGCYQTEEKRPLIENLDLADDMFLDGIMNKVAAGMKYYEREKRSGQTLKQSSYRLLILDDIYRQGYEMKSVLGTTFLPLLNVEEALKKLAEIHSTSWAFCEMTGKSFSKTWPFLTHPLYLPYIRERIIPGYFLMLEKVHEYLVTKGKEKDESKRIMKRLIKLRIRLDEILERSHHPRTVKCLIHQNTCSFNLFFRYSYHHDIRTGGWMGKKIEQKEGMKDDDDEKEEIKVKMNSTTGDEYLPKARRDCLQRRLKREVMITNWRTASFGSPMIDVAFLLLTGLPPKTRQAETGSLLKIYWKTFRASAKQYGLSVEWSDQQLYEEYLECLLYTCVLITGNIRDECKLDDNEMEAFLEAVNDLIDLGVVE
ncbi:unnamed protein product [Orchesella dallaii]|uniref:Uncharacterized protein n=1 Tax=Orchesella dallaii TaxID=48710 RepID=A0ABP1PPL3_9HEXA